MNLTFKEYYNILKYGSYIAVKPDEKTKEKIKEITKKLKLKNPIPVDELHVALMYSEGKGKPDFFASPDKEYEAIGSGFALFGDDKDTLVITLISPDLHQRFEDLSYRGFVHSYEKYRPHISLTYDYKGEKLDESLVDDLRFIFTDEYHQALSDD